MPGGRTFELIEITDPLWDQADWSKLCADVTLDDCSSCQ